MVPSLLHTYSALHMVSLAGNRTDKRTDSPQAPGPLNPVCLVVPPPESSPMPGVEQLDQVALGFVAGAHSGRVGLEGLRLGRFSHQLAHVGHEVDRLVIGVVALGTDEPLDPLLEDGDGVGGVLALASAGEFEPEGGRATPCLRLGPGLFEIALEEERCV